jgi:cellulase/cellobiase CelA1
MALPQKDIEQSIGGWFGSTPAKHHEKHSENPVVEKTPQVDPPDTLEDTIDKIIASCSPEALNSEAVDIDARRGKLNIALKELKEHRGVLKSTFRDNMKIIAGHIDKLKKLLDPLEAPSTTTFSRYEVRLNW